MKLTNLVVMLAVSCQLSALSAFAEVKGLLIDDFETTISGGPQGTVDFGAGNGSSVTAAAATDIKYSASQSLKVDYNAVSGGYIWVAKGFGLDAQNANWLRKPEEIDWAKYNSIAFYIYGSDSKTKVAVDLKDFGNEIWRFVFEDNFKGWKQIVCPFADFYARGDWQPESADKNAKIDFPIKSYQFEPLAEAKGTLYFDEVELVNK